MGGDGRDQRGIDDLHRGKSRAAAEDHGLHRTSRVRELCDEIPRAGQEVDDRDPFTREQVAECRGHHAAVPRSPVERHDAAVGSTSLLPLGDLVQDFVRDGVVRLTGAPEPRRRGREQRDRPDRMAFRRGEEVLHAVDLGAEDASEIPVRLVRDIAVGEHAGAVDQARERAELFVQLREAGVQRRGVRDVDGRVGDAGARRLHAGDVAQHLAVAMHAGVVVAEFAGGQLAGGAGEDRLLDAGLVFEVTEPIRLRARLRAATEEGKPRGAGFGEGDGDLGGDSAGAARDHDDVAAVERIRARRR